MKNKEFLIILIFITLIASESFAQVEITKSNTAYYYDNNKIDLCFYVVKNTSDSCVFLWFDKEKNNTIPLPVRVYYYLFRSKREGHFSFFSMVTELRAGTARMSSGVFIPEIGFTFIKRLSPNQSFTIILKDKSIDNFSEDFIEIVPISIFEEINRPYDWLETFEYKESFIVLR